MFGLTTNITMEPIVSKDDIPTNRPNGEYATLPEKHHR